MKLKSAVCTVLSVAGAFWGNAAIPEATVTSVSQDSRNRVIVKYTLANGPAVVTMDVETNCVTAGGTVWASIGGEHIQKVSPDSDVWKKVSGKSEYTIVWTPCQDWPDHVVPANGARVKLTAWALNNTPDYMVVDISAAAQPNTQRYYPAVEFLPGGILANKAYRTTMLVMKKVMAKDVTWTMGSVEESGRLANEASHQVTLTNNYYLAVFPTTRLQALPMFSNWEPGAFFKIPEDEGMRPADHVAYNSLRNLDSVSASDATEYYWPRAPKKNSPIDVIRTMSGLDFDLPSEAQWEFACRAGNVEGHWGDGSVIKISGDADENLAKLGRYKMNGGLVDGKVPSADCPLTNGTAVVGSYAPNDWGFYDMHGNVYEWCLDWYASAIGSYNGAVNVNLEHPEQLLSGAVGSERVFRGGSYAQSSKVCRSAARDKMSGSTWTISAQWPVGFRLCCRAGLE